MKLQDEDILHLLSHQQTLEKGLRAMMDAYQSRLYWHIKRLIVDQALVEDVLQDTFIKAYQNIHQFKSDSKLYTWLYRIATNEALQQLNKMNKMKKTDEEAEYYMQNLVADNASKNAEEIELVLQKAIQALPEKQKLVFNLRYYDDLPYEEISKILNMSVGTLKTNYHYAKEKVELYIKENFSEEF